MKINSEVKCLLEGDLLLEGGYCEQMDVIIQTCSLQMVILFELLLCPDVYRWFEDLGDIVLCGIYHK